jgi:hypothetical protein
VVPAPQIAKREPDQAGAVLQRANRVQTVDHVHVARQELVAVSPRQHRELGRSPIDVRADAQRPEVARQSLLGEEAFNGYTGAGFEGDRLPPNMRRDSSAAWSEADSEVLLVDQKDEQPGSAAGGSRWGGQR